MLAIAAAAQSSLPSPIVQANTRFAFKLFQKVTSQNSENNVLVAPTGLSLTFGLLANGSDPAAAKEIESAFEFEEFGIDQINQGFASLRAAMGLIPPSSGKTTSKGGASSGGVVDPNGTVIADSLWIKQEYFAKKFLKASHDYYGVQLMHWQTTSSADRQISAWISNATGTKVALSMGPLAKSDFLFVDVTRFHSFWRHAFEKSKTELASFTLLNGTKKKVPMMYDFKYFSYLETSRFQAVALPYTEGATMYVILPAADSSLRELEGTLTSKTWEEWLPQLARHEGLVGLPRFEVETKFDVRGALQSLGVKRAFEDFAGLRFAVNVPEGIRLTKTRQETRIKVDEEGTEAISLTIAGGVVGGIAGGRMGERPKPFSMIMNRPFFFAIRHDSTGQLLYLGAIVDP